MELLCIVVWALGQIARHCPTNVAKCDNLLPRLLYFLTKHSKSGQEEEIQKTSNISMATTYKNYSAEQEPIQELKSRCKATLRQCIQGCSTVSVLEPILHTNCPPDLMKHVLAQFARVSITKQFVTMSFVTVLLISIKH